jgi:hypothetical protein
MLVHIQSIMRCGIGKFSVIGLSSLSGAGRPVLRGPGTFSLRDDTSHTDMGCDCGTSPPVEWKRAGGQTRRRMAGGQSYRAAFHRCNDGPHVASPDLTFPCSTEVVLILNVPGARARRPAHLDSYILTRRRRGVFDAIRSGADGCLLMERRARHRRRDQGDRRRPHPRRSGGGGQALRPHRADHPAAPDTAVVRALRARGWTCCACSPVA